MSATAAARAPRPKQGWHLGYGRRISYIGTPPPLALDWVGHWLTPYEFAAQIQKSYPTVLKMARTRTLDAFGIPYMRDRRGRLWIQLLTDLT